MRRSKQAGFTLVELVIGLAIMTTIMGAAFVAQRSTQGLFASTATAGLLQDKALRSLDSAASELRWADTATFLITQENGSDRLDLQTPTGFVAEATVWSTAITYRVEASRIDADGNGAFDEGRLVRIQDGRTTLLTDYVMPGGFSATVNGDNIQLQLTLNKRDTDSNGLLTANAQTSISIRN